MKVEIEFGLLAIAHNLAKVAFRGALWQRKKQFERMKPSKVSL